MDKNSGKKILVVDDSEMARNYHGYIIKMFGYQVETAENGAIALKKPLGGGYRLLVAGYQHAQDGWLREVSGMGKRLWKHAVLNNKAGGSKWREDPCGSLS